MARTTAVANRNKLGTLASYLQAKKGQISLSLPRHMDAERFLRTVLVSASQTPRLLECTPESVYTAVSKAAQLGLEVNNGLGSAYLVPYGKDCQLIIGYKGMIDLARRSGEIHSIEARVVHEKDEFELEYGFHPKLAHRPCMTGDAGPPILVYAVAHLKGGAPQVEVMTLAQVEAVRKASRAGGSGPWVDHWEQMARKTVIRRLFNYLPCSVEMAQAMALDVEGPSVSVEEPTSKVEQLRVQVEAEASDAELAYVDDLIDSAVSSDEDRAAYRERLADAARAGDGEAVRALREELEAVA